MYNHEKLLSIWFETEPTVTSPYKLYGCPPMWATIIKNNYILFTRPCKVQTKDTPNGALYEVDGLSCQWQKDGKWIGQGIQYTFADFENKQEEDKDIHGHKSYDVEKIMKRLAKR